MPPKSVTCSICTTEVLKSQTLARADGSRACRSHEGVANEAEARQAAERARLDVAIAKANRPWMGIPEPTDASRLAFEKEAAEFREHIYSHCWTCGEYGLEGREFFAQAMVAMKRLQMRGEFNFFSMPTDVRKLMGNIPMLSAIKLGDSVQDRAVVKHVSDRRVRDLVPLLGFVLLCVPCIDKHGFKARLEALLPKPTWDQIEAMLPVVAGMEPVLRAMAEKKEGQS